MVCVFTRATSEPLASLVKQIDSKIGEEKSLKSFVVLIPKKGEAAKESLQKLAKEGGVKHVPLTIGEAPNGPPDYGVSEEADVTVIMWNRHKVKVNHAFKGELTEKDIAAVVNDIPKILGK